MNTLKRITEPGEYGDVSFRGDSRINDIGLVIDVWGNKPVVIDRLEIMNVFIPIIKLGDAPLFINDVYIYLFGGDGSNIRGSNFHADLYQAEGATPVRPYNTITLLPGESVEAALERNEVIVYDPKLLTAVERNGELIIPGYHSDAMQVYGVKKDKFVSEEDDLIENISVNNIKIDMPLPYTQGIVMTERCKYKNFKLGTSSMNMQTGHYYSVMATNMEDFIIGSGTDMDSVNKPVRIQRVKGVTHKITDGQILLPGNHVVDTKPGETVAMLDTLGNDMYA